VFEETNVSRASLDLYLQQSSSAAVALVQLYFANQSANDTAS
jgi:hypothetical protein